MATPPSSPCRPTNIPPESTPNRDTAHKQGTFPNTPYNYQSSYIDRTISTHAAPPMATQTAENPQVYTALASAAAAISTIDTLTEKIGQALQFHEQCAQVYQDLNRYIANYNAVAEETVSHSLYHDTDQLWSQQFTGIKTNIGQAVLTFRKASTPQAAASATQEDYNALMPDLHNYKTQLDRSIEDEKNLLTNIKIGTQRIIHNVITLYNSIKNKPDLLYQLENGPYLTQDQLTAMEE